MNFTRYYQPIYSVLQQFTVLLAWAKLIFLLYSGDLIEKYSLENNTEHLGTQNSAKPKEDQLSPKVLWMSGTKGEKKKGKYLKENTIKESVKLQNQGKKEIELIYT